MQSTPWQVFLALYKYRWCWTQYLRVQVWVISGKIPNTILCTWISLILIHQIQHQILIPLFLSLRAQSHLLLLLDKGEGVGSESILLQFLFTWFLSSLTLLLHLFTKRSLVVHGFLKRGVYKPVRTKYSRLAAATAAFLASGFFHEWLLSVTLYPDYDSDSIGECTPPSCFRPGYGRNTLFFVWNAALIGIEYAVSGATVFKLLKAHLPLTAISLLVTSTALPVAHWFTNDYVRTDFFHDGQLGWPIIIRLDE